MAGGPVLRARTSTASLLLEEILPQVGQALFTAGAQHAGAVGAGTEEIVLVVGVLLQGGGARCAVDELRARKTQRR